MITPKNLKTVIQWLKENHGSYAEAAKVTGVSPAYFSRVASGSLQPKDIKQDIQKKLLKGLSLSQKEKLIDKETQRGLVQEIEAQYRAEPNIKRDPVYLWLKSLTAKQYQAVQTLVDMIQDEE